MKKKIAFFSAFLSSLAFAGLIFLSGQGTNLGSLTTTVGYFNGSAYGDAGNVAALDIDGSINPSFISAWGTTNSLATFQQIVTKRDIGGSFRGFELGLDTSANIISELAAGSGSNKLEVTWSPNIAVGVPHHYCKKSDGSGLNTGESLYLDGSLLTPTNIMGGSASISSTTQNTAPFRVGARNNGTLFWNGTISHVLYGSGNPDCAAIFAMGQPINEIALAGLVSWFRFDVRTSPADGTSTIYDRKGTNNLTNNGVTFVAAAPLIGPVAVATFDGTSSSGSFPTSFNYEYTQAFSGFVAVKPSFQQHGSDVGYEAQQDVIGNTQFHGVEGGFDIARGWRFVLFDTGVLNDWHLCPSLQLLSTNALRAEIIGNCPVVLDTWTTVGFSTDGTGTVAGMHTYAAGSAVTPASSIDALANNTIVSSVNAWLGDLQHFTNPDGSDPPINHYYFKGPMGTVCMWNVALSAGNFATLNTATVNGVVNCKTALPSQASHLVGSYFRRWNTLNDDSGAGNDGTAANMVFTF